MPMFSRLAINDEGFVFDPTTGDSFMVNLTGLLILRGLRDGSSPNTIARDISEAYEVDLEDADRDVVDFLERVKGFGLA